MKAVPMPDGLAEDIDKVRIFYLISVLNITCSLPLGTSPSILGARGVRKTVLFIFHDLLQAKGIQSTLSSRTSTK